MVQKAYWWTNGLRKMHDFTLIKVLPSADFWLVSVGVLLLLRLLLCSPHWFINTLAHTHRHTHAHTHTYTHTFSAVTQDNVFNSSCKVIKVWIQSTRACVILMVTVNRRGYVGWGGCVFKELSSAFRQSLLHSFDVIRELYRNSSNPYSPDVKLSVNVLMK